jgi:hypothetical protein
MLLGEGEGFICDSVPEMEHMRLGEEKDSFSRGGFILQDCCSNGTRVIRERRIHLRDCS